MDNSIGSTPSNQSNPFEQLTQLAATQKDEQAKVLKDNRAHEFALEFAKSNVELMMMGNRVQNFDDNLRMFHKSYLDAKKAFLA
ncbi:MAG TPA: hypothetical protein DCW31_11345 [Lactobacillus sp.]|nr:hypothetical protein [Lactobacillus sp.]